MTITNFKTVVAAYMNRSLASLTDVNGQDILLLAMNDARRDAQADHPFELLRTEDVYLSTHAGGTSWMDSCETAPSSGVNVKMRRIDEIWNYGPYVIDGTTYYTRSTRIPYNYTGFFKRELDSATRLRWNDQTNSATNQFAYCNGDKLFVTASNTATYYKIVGVKWLTDLDGSEDPDLFLIYFTTWFKYATILALNVYLKDEDRFGIDKTEFAVAWERVKSMDGSIANMGESADLD
jgi:hypothetical protein